VSPGSRINATELQSHAPDEGISVIMRGRVSRSTKITITLVLLCGWTACKNHAPNVEPRDYLEKAFADMAKNAPSSTDQKAREKVQRIILGIRKEASQKKYYIESTDLADLGYPAFPSIAPLLKDPDPWVRVSTIRVLFQLDPQTKYPVPSGHAPGYGKNSIQGR
jgi:hypothetical protein